MNVRCEWCGFQTEDIDKAALHAMTCDAQSDDSFGEDCEPNCMTCSGDGIVDAVAGETGGFGWDDDGPGTCPNCNGSGKRKDQRYF